MYLYDLTKSLKAISSDKLMNLFNTKSILPLFTFKGHSKEGFALDWSSTTSCLASGDQIGQIFIWKANELCNSWNVDQTPLTGHTSSVEDIQWSTEQNILASCSVDKSIRIWDIRTATASSSMIKINESHTGDVNVISWNKLDPKFLLSGGDDGLIKCWDLRTLQTSSKPLPIATLSHHTEPITSIEWSPNDSSAFVASSEDNQISIWDLACEKDEQQQQQSILNQEESAELDKLPDQLLFIHQGQKEIKEVHWHSQLPGYLVSTSLSGFDIFRTISV